MPLVYVMHGLQMKTKLKMKYCWCINLNTAICLCFTANVYYIKILFHLQDEKDELFVGQYYTKMVS